MNTTVHTTLDAVFPKFLGPYHINLEFQVAQERRTGRAYIRLDLPAVVDWERIYLLF